MPNIKNYQNDNNKIVTDLLVTPFGGQSVNSEFEILTGSSISFFANGFIPYTQYYNKNKDNHFSLIQEFKNNSYDTAYLTPWGPESYNSGEIYNKVFLIDKAIYKDQLHNPNVLRGVEKGDYLSDDVFINEIYEELKNTDEGKYKFIMSASGQNHFPFYKDKYSEEEYVVNVVKSNYSKETTEMLRAYAQGVYDADRTLNDLYLKIQQLDTPTIIVFFGDHLPYMTQKNGQNEFISSKYFNTDDENVNEMRLHTTKGVILSNYDIDTDELNYINLNYLGAYVANKLDLNISNYLKYVDSIRKEIPIFNRNIVYEDNKLVPIKNSISKDLTNYKIVQYYKFYDYK